MRTTIRVLAALASAAALGVSLVGTASAKVDPNLNHASYWESEGVTCSKVEWGGDVKMYTVPAGTGFVVVKNGQDSTQHWMGPDPYTVYFDKGVSHVITCTGSYGS